MLSFVIPVYKTPPELRERCKRSIRACLAAGCGSVEVIEIDGLPLAEARNKGLRQAKGDWVWFVDADDEARPEVVLHQVNATGEQWDFDILMLGVRTRWGRIGKRWETIPPKLDGEMTAVELKNLNDNLLFRYAWNKIYRREFLLRNDIWFESGTEPCEDAIFNLKCVKASARWRSVQKVGYVYWKRLGSSLFRYCPTVEKAFRRENELWEGLRVVGVLASCGGWEWSEDQISARVWDNRWLRGSPERNPPFRWKIHQSALLVRRGLRFCGV